MARDFRATAQLQRSSAGGALGDSLILRELTHFDRVDYGTRSPWIARFHSSNLGCVRKVAICCALPRPNVRRLGRYAALVQPVPIKGTETNSLRRIDMKVAVDINETCLTVAEVAERLKVNEETARRLFLNEPGVIVICWPRRGVRV